MAIDMMEHKDLIVRWGLGKIQELRRYGMTEEDFLNDFWIKFESHKGRIMESFKIHDRNEGAFISLLCNRHLIDLRRKYIKRLSKSLDEETFEGNGDTLADSLEDRKSFDFSLLFEMTDAIPNKKCTRKFSYKELFQIILDEGNEPVRLAEILNVSRARVSQVTKELLGYLKA